MLGITGKPIYRMSSAGGCPRALSASRQGYPAEPAPEWLETAAEEGKWHEQRVKGKLGEEGYNVFDEQREVRLEYPTFTLLGHIDGTVMSYGRTEGRLLEVKSMSQFEFDRWMREGFRGFHGYADQLTCYMEATGLKEALYIVKNRSSGYEDRRVIAEQPSDINAIVAKLADIEDWLARMVEPGAREGLYPAEFDPNSLECRRCEYKQHCAPEPKELGSMEKADLESAAEEWRKGKRLVDKGQQLIELAKQSFEQHTKATGIDKWRWAELAIALIHVKETLAYPKAKLLQIFTEEQLEPASEIKLPYEYIKVKDLREETAEENQNEV